MANKRPKKGEKYYFLRPGGTPNLITYKVGETEWIGQSSDIWMYENEEIFSSREEAEDAAWERNRLNRLGKYRPAKGDVYFYMKSKPGSYLLEIAKTVWLGNRDDRRRKCMGMCFETAEDAMFYNRIFQKLMWG